MKKLTTTLTVMMLLLGINSFAQTKDSGTGSVGSAVAPVSKTDKTSNLEQIYSHGYMLEGTVTQELGILLRADMNSSSLRLGPNCRLQPTSAASSQNRVLRKGRKITFGDVSNFNSGHASSLDAQYNGGLDQSIVRVIFYKPAAQVSIAEIEASCGLSLEIKPNLSLIDGE